jgi:hypothetical protein
MNLIINQRRRSSQGTWEEDQSHSHSHDQCHTSSQNPKKKRLSRVSLIFCKQPMGTAQGTPFSCDRCNCVNGLDDCRSDRKSGMPSRGPAGSSQHQNVQNFFPGKNPMRETGILDAAAKKSGYRRPPPLQNKSALLLALTQSKENSHQENSPSDDGGWTPREDARLEAAIKTVSSSKNFRLPMFKELASCFKDGDFQDNASRDYWSCVSGKLQSRDAAACFHRYRHLRGTEVARFSVSPRIKSGSVSR